MGFYDSNAIESVRAIVARLRETALSKIPDLDEIRPGRDWKPADGGLERWEPKARAKAAEAIDWRDALEALIGDIGVGHKVVDHPKLGSERVPNRDTLLGQFYEGVPDGTRHRSAYVPGGHPIQHLGNARMYLGVPPSHLVNPSFYERLSKDIGLFGTPIQLGRDDWSEYSEIILHQCLIERARALELCAWCDARIEAWESAYYPTIYVGPKRKARNRSLRVLVAGLQLDLPKDTIADALAELLLKLRDGRHVSFAHRNSFTYLINAIPPLSGLLRNTGKTTGPTTQGGVYALPPEVQILEDKSDK